MSKNKYIILLVLLLVILISLYLYLNVKTDTLIKTTPPLELPLKNEVEYIENVNEFLNETYQSQQEAKANPSPEIEAQKKAQLKLLQKLTQLAMKDITLYAKIIDQYGQPVEGVEVVYSGGREFLALGTSGKKTTDSNGLFLIDDAKGSNLEVISFKKEGYQFPVKKIFYNPKEGADYPRWNDFTKENPFIFKAWKVTDGEYPNTSHASSVYGFDLGKVYSMDFTVSKGKWVKKEGKLPLDLQVEFNRDDFNWHLVLSVPNGGLIETENSYMNLAPSQGYLNQLEFSGTKKERVVEKSFYLFSRGEFYSRLKVRIRPFSRKKSALFIDHVMNLDGNRNLEVKKRR